MVLFLSALFLESSNALSVPGIEILHVSTIFLLMGLLAFYISHALRNRRLAREDRFKWTIALLIGHFITIMVYWFIILWRPQAEGQSLSLIHI